MRYALSLLLFLVLGASGCVSKGKARAEAMKAFAAGHEQAVKELQNREPVVIVLGSVRNHSVPWEEGMTLAQAIDAAFYTGFRDPQVIRLTRGDETIEIRASELLRGSKNPVLQAGDVINLSR